MITPTTGNLYLVKHSPGGIRRAEAVQHDALRMI